MAKKSKAQLKRLQKRAKARGERYEEKKLEQEKEREQEQEQQQVGFNDDNDDDGKASSSAPNTTEKDNNKKKKLLRQIGMELKHSLESIAKDDTLKSKERRSAKRKAEAIAMEKAGEAANGGTITCSSAEELLALLEEDHNATTDASIARESRDCSSNSDKKKRKKNNTDDGDNVDSTKKKKKKRTNPYIVFVGQLSYDTTKESLLAHFQNELGKETNEAGQPFDISEETLQVRLLTDPKTKRSRGMAFVEVVHDDPELLYACLKLHQTFLEGRRINVERSAGGKRNSSSRQSKIQQHRQDQDEYMKSVVQTMLQEHYDNGSIQKGELDDGVVALCCRHAATIVEAALENYCESHGRDMDNPSAYLSFLLSKMAEEGIYEKDSNYNNNVDSKKKSRSHRKKVRAGSSRKNEVISGSPFLKQKYNDPTGKQGASSTSFSSNNANNNNNKNHPLSSSSSSSEFAKQGIDMSISDNNNIKTDAASTADLSSIFPSYSSRGGRKG